MKEALAARLASIPILSMSSINSSSRRCTQLDARPDMASYVERLELLSRLLFDVERLAEMPRFAPPFPAP